jgi:hypothetical protein
MAVASLVLSCFGFFPPFGIASVVMGHVARVEIVKSRGAMKGMGAAFTGLILSYPQLGIFTLFCLVTAAEWHRMNQALEGSRWTRAAIVAQLEHPSSELTTAAAGERHQQEAIAALKLIRDKQNRYIATHREIGYACNLNQLGYYVVNQSELGLHIRQSHYQIDVRECRGTNEITYLVMAVPRSNENPKDAPVLCLDQTDVIRRIDAAADVACRTMGERVE